jgi:hypothetical protein
MFRKLTDVLAQVNPSLVNSTLRLQTRHGQLSPSPFDRLISSERIVKLTLLGFYQEPSLSS